MKKEYKVTSEQQSDNESYVTAVKEADVPGAASTLPKWKTDTYDQVQTTNIIITVSGIGAYRYEILPLIDQVKDDDVNVNFFKSGDDYRVYEISFTNPQTHTSVMDVLKQKQDDGTLATGGLTVRFYSSTAHRDYLETHALMKGEVVLLETITTDVGELLINRTGLNQMRSIDEDGLSIDRAFIEEAGAFEEVRAKIKANNIYHPFVVPFLASVDTDRILYGIHSIRRITIGQINCYVGELQTFRKDTPPLESIYLSTRIIATADVKWSTDCDLINNYKCNFRFCLTA